MDSAVQFVKLNVLAFKDAAYTQPSGSPYIALLNPESYTIEHKLELSNENQAQGPVKAEAKFVKTAPASMNFDFLFDASGALNDQVGSYASVAGLDADIKNFMNQFFTSNPSTHQPPYLQIVWGGTMFKGKFESISINYKLFDSSGNPIRAVLKCVLRSSSDPTTGGNISSPDLTHLRVVTTSDTLPLMCYTIYGSPSYYIQVAQLNGIANFRKLQVGSSIYFPPLS